MDCQEKDIFYTSDDNYSNLLGIGKPQGFLGLKKLFNTKGYQSAMFQQFKSNRVELEPIPSIQPKILKIEYGQPQIVEIPTTFKPTPTSKLDVRGLFQDALDTAVVIAKNKAQQRSNQNQTTPTPETPTQPVVGSTTNSEGYSKDPRENLPKDNTMLYVGLAGAGILLISGFAFMASKGK